MPDPVEEDTHQSLDAGEVDRPPLPQITVVEREIIIRRRVDNRCGHPNIT